MERNKSRLQLLGAGGLGCVLGWYLHNFNRHRSSDESPADPARIRASFDRAVEEKSATFDQVAEAYYHRLEPFHKNADERREYDRYYPKLLEAFEHHHGRVQNAYWGELVECAVVITDKHELHGVCNAHDPPAVRALLDEACEKVRDEAKRLLVGREWQVTVNRLYALGTNLVAALSNYAGRRRRIMTKEIAQQLDTDLRAWRADLTDIEAYFHRAAYLDAIASYAIGMLAGSISLGVAVLVTSLFLGRGSVIAWVVFAGGLGGLVSVLQRMASNTFAVDYTVGKWAVRFFGATRPLLAAGLAFAVYIVIAGGLIPLAIPSDPDKQRYFYAGIAFLAGFSERYAQDILEVTGRQAAGLVPRVERRKEAAKPSVASGS